MGFQNRFLKLKLGLRFRFQTPWFVGLLFSKNKVSEMPFSGFLFLVSFHNQDEGKKTRTRLLALFDKVPNDWKEE